MGDWNAKNGKTEKEEYVVMKTNGCGKWNEKG